MHWLVEHIGGSYRVGHKNGRVPCYTWVCASARNVHAISRRVLPYLVIKPRKAGATISCIEFKYGERIHG
jgi:hypothetical protein